MPQRHASFPTRRRRLIRADYRKTRAARSLRATPFGPLGTVLSSALPACSSLRKPRYRLLRAYHHTLQYSIMNPDLCGMLRLYEFVSRRPAYRLEFFILDSVFINRFCSITLIWLVIQIKKGRTHLKVAN